MPLQYAERLPIGLKEIIEGVPATTVRAFYERWYRPENMAVVIAGDFDPHAVEKLLKSALSSCSWDSSAPAVPVPRQASLHDHKKLPAQLFCNLHVSLGRSRPWPWAHSCSHLCCNPPLLICMTRNEGM